MNSWLEVWRESGAVDRIDLNKDQLTLGRGDSSDVQVGDVQASRLHAVLERLGTEWCVRDVGSRNGTFVNGRQIAGQARLRGGDEMRVGRTRLVLRGAEVADLGEITEMQKPPPRITSREQDVLVELFRPNVMTGVFNDPATPREIAEHLWVTEGAVKHHLSNLYEKFEINGEPERRRIRLANEALRRGVITIAEVHAKLNTLTPDHRNAASS